jgi:beta-1,4-mannosyl-glycoprotein beta-1,4-N-acetylglucosaminyltransferase
VSLGMSHGRIFDCFTFAAELDLLEFRLQLLDGIVDVFVIVEAPSTFSGRQKPLFFETHRERFKIAQSEVRVVVVDDLPPPSPNRWVPDHFQRNAIVRGLDDARAEDLILVTDVDEIPNPSVVRVLNGLVDASAVLEMRFCYYRANLQFRAPWPLARCCRFESLESPQALRDSKPRTIVPNAGVHFSYLMTPAEIARKYGWFAHAELDNERARAPHYLRAMTRLGVSAVSHEVLAHIPLEQADPVQRALFERHPEYFDLAPPAPPLLRRVASGWSKRRGDRRVPDLLARAGDSLLDVSAGFFRRGQHGWDGVAQSRPGEEISVPRQDPRR